MALTVLPADQSGEEHAFFRIRVERSDLRDLTRTGPDRSGEADLGPSHDGSFDFFDGQNAIRVDIDGDNLRCPFF